MPRPICVHCGNFYGRRATHDETVVWETPTQDREIASERLDNYRTTIKVPLNPPPPYRGNGVVVKTSDPRWRDRDGKMAITRTIWDGESWSGGYDPFCTLRCALDYARKAYARTKQQPIRRVK